MDWSSIAGLVIAVLGILAGQSIEGSSIMSLFQLAPFLIVVLGTLGAVLLQSKPETFLDGIRKLQTIFFVPVNDHPELSAKISAWSTITKKEGALSLEIYRDQETDPFILKGLQLLMDGFPAETIREICLNDLHEYEIRQRNAIKIWDSAGGYSPTIGILAAVMGLMHVMEKLTDPSLIGAGIAVAFVATIYGVGLANLFFIPVATKLKAHTQAEIRKYEMIIESLSHIAAGENTVIVQERLASYQR
jgi:chemotaxis protein MotA